MALVPWNATVQDDAGNYVPLPVVTVRNSADDTLATIYDEAGSPLSNPLTGLANGFVQFFVEPGRYTIEGALDGSTTATWVWEASLSSGIDAYSLTVTQAAIDAMETDLGYVRISRQMTVTENVTFSAPIYFDPGAYLDTQIGFTTTIYGYIESPKQWIFRGEGSYDLGGPGTAGEVSRQIHASWFGAFPGPATIGGSDNDQAPYITAAFQALGNDREAEVLFDIGNYQMFSGTEVLRAISVVGKGSRRTVFKSNADGFIPFTATGEACRFKGIQFEHSTQLTAERASPYIRIEGNNCDMEDVIGGRAFRSFEVAANGFTCRDVTGFFNVDGSAGSSLIALKGSNHIVENTQTVMSGAFGPDQIIHVGAPLGGSVSVTSAVTVDGVQNNSASIPVLVDAANHNVSNVVLRGISTNPASAAVGVRIQATSTSSLEGVTINGLQAGSTASPGLDIVQSGTSTLQDIKVSGIDVTGATGVGVAISQSSGTLRDIQILSGDLSERATPVSRSGAMTNIDISALVLNPDAINQVLVGDVSIADDAVYVIDLGAARFSSIFSVVTNAGAYGQWRGRAAPSPALSAMLTANGIVTTTGALTGTTGVDGNITASVGTDGKYYLENRSGASITVTMVVT